MGKVRPARRAAGRRQTPSAAVTAAVVAVLLLAGCRPDTVDLRFRPEVGTVYRYRAEVRSQTTTELPDRDPQVDHRQVTLDITQRVLGRDPDGTTRLEVHFDRQGIAARTFEIQVDRAAQLTTLEQIDGLPVEAVQALGLVELLPAAVGTPPDRLVRPGERWVIDQPVPSPSVGAAPALRGEGRLRSVGVESGRRVGVVWSSTRLPWASTQANEDGTQELSGVQAVTSLTRHDLADGSVLASSSTTVGSFGLVLRPPTGDDARSLVGRLRVEIRTELTRVD